MRIKHLARDDFLANYFDPEPGEHIQFISPTGGGKTYFLYQCVRKMQRLYPDLSYLSLMPKPRDPATEQWAGALGLKVTSRYPASRWPWQQKPAGHVLWPEHIASDELANRERLSAIFRDALSRQYWQGDSVTVADDAYILGVLLGLNPELDRHWTAGRSGNASLITALQKPSGTVGGAISSFAYDSPTHLFLGRDNDERNLKRFSEIAVSQIDPDQIRSVVRHLPVRRIGNSAVSDMLYLDRRGPYLATISPA